MILKKTIKYFLLMISIIALGYFSAVIFFRPEMEETAAVISNENNPSGKVLGEEGNEASSEMFASQNFRAPEISFGGDAIVIPSGTQSLAPEILNMRSQLLAAKSDQKVKFLLSWKTNKLCQSSIEYMREGQAEGKIISEDGYGYVHSVEISPLNYSTSYSYKVTARDKWGNEIQSDKLAFYTGAPNVSIFDLLGGAFKDMFGWAGR